MFLSSEVIINDANGHEMTLSVIFILNVFGIWENTAHLTGICVVASTGMHGCHSEELRLDLQL